MVKGQQPEVMHVEIRRHYVLMMLIIQNENLEEEVYNFYASNVDLWNNVILNKATSEAHDILWAFKTITVDNEGLVIESKSKRYAERS